MGELRAGQLLQLPGCVRAPSSTSEARPHLRRFALSIQSPVKEARTEWIETPQKRRNTRQPNLVFVGWAGS